MAYTTILTAEGANISGDNFRLTIQYKDPAINAFKERVEADGGTYEGTTDCLNPILIDFRDINTLTCTFAKPIFRLRYSPAIDDISGSLAPSRLEVFLINEPNNTNLDDFLNNVLTAQQSSAWGVLLEKDTGSGYTDYWRGVLLQDQITEEDRSYNNVVKLSAVDGLALLKARDYGAGSDFTGNTNTSAEPFYTTVLDVIRYALLSGIDSEFWGASDNYLTTSVDWWEDTQTYGALLDPLVTQVFDVRAFEKVVGRSDGFSELETKTAYEVLEEFAKVYLARVYMAGGAYRFEQIELRDSQTVKEVKYDKSGIQLSVGLNNKSVTINKTLDAARLAGNEFLRFPALKEVEVSLSPYASDFDNDISLTAANYLGSETNNFGYFDQNVGNIVGVGAVSQAIILNVDFNIQVDWDWVSGDIKAYSNTASKGYIGIRPICRAKIELNDINSSTNYYWNGTAWQTSSTTFNVIGADKVIYVNTGSSSTIKYRPADNVTQVIQTTDLPATGTITITLDNYRVQYLSAIRPVFTWANFTFSLVNPDNWGGTVDLTLSTLFQRGNTVRVFSLINSDINVADNERYTYPEIKVSDGSIQTGCIMVNNSGTIVAANDWRVANGAEDVALGSLLVQRRLELQRDVLEQYAGTVKLGYSYDIAMVFDSKVWVPMDYELDGYSNDVNATWTKIGIVPEVTNVVSEKNPKIGFLSGSAQGFFKYGGPYRVGGQTMADNAVLGFVYDDSEEVSNATAPLFMQTGQRNNYILVDASSGGSSTLSETDTVALVSWTGAAGSYTLNIADASNVDGARLEIILDDTFDGSQDIVITPAGGNIQGATELTVNTTGRNLLRAINGNWW